MLLPTLFLLPVMIVKCLFLLSQPLGMESLHLLPVSANLAIALEEVFEIDGPDFDFLGMHSVINAFCQKYNITGKLETAQQLTDRMLNDIMAAYRPITVRITHSEQSGYCAHPSGLRAQGWSAQPQLLCGGEVRSETEIIELKM